MSFLFGTSAPTHIYLVPPEQVAPMRPKGLVSYSTHGMRETAFLRFEGFPALDL